MKTGMKSKTPFLSCEKGNIQSFLSCGQNSPKTLSTTTAGKVYGSSAQKLSCNSSISSEEDSQPTNNYREKTLIVGIDPGITGAIAFVKAGSFPSFVAVYDLPTLVEKSGKTRLDLNSLSLLVSTYSEDVKLSIVEEVGFMTGKEARGSAFVFGFATGAVHGVLASYSIDTYCVKPAVWKGALGLDANKEKSVQKAISLFPEASQKLKLKKHHGRAEALLLAYFAHSILTPTKTK
jgi:crossover junction endodeoxyribonuclease RuvC